MDEKALEIRVDYREDRSGVAEILTQECKIEVVRESLKAGDYLMV